MPDTKKLLQFYFRVDKLNEGIDNLILKAALSSVDYRNKTEHCAEKIGKLIYDKQVLSGLWGYLDGVMCELGNSERMWLLEYATGRNKTLTIYDKEVKAATTKFTRHLRSLDLYVDALALVNHYFGFVG